MAVDPASSVRPPCQTSTNHDLEKERPAPGDETAIKKIDPNSEDGILNAAAEAFLPMISNQFMLNSTLFNFAQEAIDEADQ